MTVNTKAFWNRTLLWKDWKNSMAMILLYFGMIFQIYPLTLLRGLAKATEHKRQSALAYIVYRFGRPPSGLTLIVVMSVVLLGSLLLGEERKRSTYNLLLAMPFSRKQIFISKYILGVGSVIAVYLINGLLLAIILASNSELRTFLSAQRISSWVLSQMVIMVTILSFTFVFAAMTGTIAASTVLTGIFLIFPEGFVELIQINLGRIYGYFYVYDILSPYGHFSRAITLVSYAADNHLVLQRWPLLLGASALMAVLALKIFEANPMEKNGEVLVIETVKPLFRIGVPLCFMLLIGGLFADSLGVGLGYVVGAALGGVIVQYTIGLRKTAS